MKKMIDAQVVLDYYETEIKPVYGVAKPANMLIEFILDMISDTKRAEIWMIFPDTNEEYRYGTYDFTTDLEKCYVNELAMKIRDERDCWIDIREV